MWIICVSIILAGVVIVAVEKMPDTSSNYSHLNYDKYVTVGKYKGLEAEQKADKVTSESIKTRIDSEVGKQTETKTVKKGTVKKGDTITVDYTGTLNGEKFIGGSGKDQVIQVGSGGMLKDFEDSLVGKNVGDTFKTDVTFPKKYDNQQVAGKTANFEITIKSKTDVKEYKYDDEFLKKFTKYDNKKDYEAYIKSVLEKEAAETAEETCKTDLWNNVLDDSKVKQYPKKQYKYEYGIAKGTAESYAEMYGVSLSDYITNYMQSTPEEFNKQLKEEAKETTKEKLVAYKIAENENISVSEEDEEEWLKEQLKAAGITVKDFESQNETTLENYIKENDVKSQAVIKKVKDFIYKEADIK